MPITNTGNVLKGVYDNTTVVDDGGASSLNSSNLDRYASNLYATAMQKKAVGASTKTDIIGAPFNKEEGATGPVTIKRMKNDAHEKYSQGDLIFLHSTSTEFHNDNETTAVALWNLNAGLEERARIRRSEINTQEIGGSIQQMIAKRKRTRETTLDGSIFPLTLEQFLQEWSFIGVLESQNQKIGPSSKATNNRLLGIRFEGTTHDVTNLWGNVFVGDRVGVLVKEIPNRFDRFYDLDGNVKGEATSGSYLQVIPCSQDPKNNYKFPASSSQFLEPKLKDRDYWTEGIIDQNQYAVDDLGLIDFNKGSQDKKSFIFQDYKQGFFLQLGIVKHVRRHNEDERIINMATRTHKHYNALKKKGTVSLYLTSMGHLPTRC